MLKDSRIITEEEYEINDEIFETLKQLLSYLDESLAYSVNKFNILNYIFSLLLNTYRLNIINKEEYFNSLKKFINELSLKYNTDLVLSLKSENLTFYRMIQDNDTVRELELIIENNEFEKENFLTNMQLNKFRTLIMDFKNVGTEENMIDIEEFPQDEKSKFTLDKFRGPIGSGIQVKSYGNKITFQIKCIKKGTLNIYLRGSELKDIKSNRIPLLIDLKSFKINNKPLIEDSKLITYEKPFKHEIEVEDQEILTVSAEWSEVSNQSTYKIKNSTNSALTQFDTIRFEIKNRGNEENNVEIISNSDDESTEYAPEWLSDEYGIGKIIKSFNEKIHFKVKCEKKGKLTINMRTLDLRDKYRQRIPIKVDLEKLVINDETLIDENTLISHDSPYSYKKEVEDGEVIDVQVEWSPISNKSTYFESENIRDDLKPFTTIRFDIKNKGNKDNKFEIISNNDKNLINYQSKWLTDDTGEGQTLKTTKGDIHLKLRCVNDGELSINLRAINMVDKQNNRIPVKVDITKLMINGEIQVETNTLISYKKPIKYVKTVKDGEIVDIVAKWKPISKESTYHDVKRIRPDLKPFITARFDVKNKGNEDNGVQIITNDEYAIESTPSWFTNKEGQGKIIKSSKGEIKFHIKCIKNGTLQVALRSTDLRDKTGYRIPIMIDYTSLTINKEELIKENTLISHDHPYKYTKEVIDGEIIDVTASWAPLSSNSIYNKK